MRQRRQTNLRACNSHFSVKAVQRCDSSLFCSQKEPHIAVLGGGITGLSAAFHLARKFPTTKITLIEGSNRVGGWLNSHRVDVGSGTVLLEKGPRTLRSSSKGTLELVSLYYFLHICLIRRGSMIDSPLGVGEGALDGCQIRTSSSDTIPAYQWFLSRSQPATKPVLPVVVDNISGQRRVIRRRPARLLDCLQPAECGG